MSKTDGATWTERAMATVGAEKTKAAQAASSLLGRGEMGAAARVKERWDHLDRIERRLWARLAK